MTFRLYLDEATPEKSTALIRQQKRRWMGVRKGKLVQQWLASHPCFVPVFTPMHCSWINQIER